MTPRPSVPRVVRRAWLAFVVVALPALLVLAFLLPLTQDAFQLQVGTLVAVYTLAVVGLDALAGRAGLLHLGYGVVFGTGAYTVAVLAQHWTGPVILSILAGTVLAGVVAGILGALLAQASRYAFAVLTLAAAAALSSIVSNVSWLGGTAGLGGVSRDFVGSGDLSAKQTYLVIGGIVALSVVLYAQFRSTRTGRAIEALRVVPEVAQASGINLPRLRMKLAILSGAIGGLAGGLFAMLQQYVSADIVGATHSVNLLAMNIIGGAGIAWAGFPGALIAVGLPQEIQSLVSYQLVTVGAVMGLVALWLRVGIAGALQEGWHRAVIEFAPDRVRWRSQRPVQGRVAVTPLPPHRATPGEAVLRVDGVAVSFGGLSALKGVSLELRAGVVHALVGPNGSGKTTLVGVIAGSNLRFEGTVIMRGDDISRLGPDARVHRGITRTFQLVTLCPTLSVLENVMLGGHGMSRERFTRDFFSLYSRAGESEFAARAWRILDDLGAGHIALLRPSVLTAGQQRLVEVARCLMTDADVIMLDEPAAGLSPDERAHLADIIRRLTRAGRAVLLIEHDMEFVMALADTITVLADGEILAEGEPEKVRDDPAVIEAYWGKAVAAT